MSSLISPFGGAPKSYLSGLANGTLLPDVYLAGLGLLPRDYFAQGNTQNPDPDAGGDQESQPPNLGPGTGEGQASQPPSDAAQSAPAPDPLAPFGYGPGLLQQRFNPRGLAFPIFAGVNRASDLPQSMVDAIWSRFGTDAGAGSGGNKMLVGDAGTGASGKDYYPPDDPGEDESDTGPGAMGGPGSFLQGDPLHPFSKEGEFVVLPDGSQVPDETSPTGYLMSPIADLSNVAAAGRETGSEFWTQAFNPETAGGATPSLYFSLFRHLGHGGAFDYQRKGNPIFGYITGFDQFPKFRNVSNFNVGLFSQQSGATLDETLTNAGQYARMLSGNANASQPYGLDKGTADFIKTGYDAGRSGVFGQAARRP